MCVGEGGLEGQDRRQKDKFGIRCRSKTRVQAMMVEVEMDREKWSDSDIKRDRIGKTASLPLS